MIYLSAIKTFIYGEIEFKVSTSFGFAQNTLHDFPNTILNSKKRCLPQMPQKLNLSLEWYFYMQKIQED